MAGRVLAAVSTSPRVLPRTKPLHPRGSLHEARLEVAGLPAPTGAPLLDGGPVARDCLVRVSRAVGLPEPWPDITGAAVRVSGADGGDLLFASTGTGRWTRFLLLPRSSRWSGTLTTLLPFRTRLGLTWLALRPTGRNEYQLLCATQGGAWAVTGVLRIGRRIGTGDELRFGPVQEAPAGLVVPRPLALLRQPAYERARDRGRPGTQPR
ncbi:hypothetical protein [Ornithinicoccus halotolerans]|uniref:hypothetical protein n=1 Tax=Ornithinicoccus halotolerans TaxID=1748220 RepID=UPI0012971ACD|nr:hypothetical protein [Ornithinicoccus halotolerans]